MLGESPTLTNLGNDHEFISKKCISIVMIHFEKAQSQSENGQYHTIVESRDF